MVARHHDPLGDLKRRLLPPNDMLRQELDVPLQPAPQSPRKGTVDWHGKRRRHEPACPPDCWRTINRLTVIPIAMMEDSHLNRAILYASSKRAHASRLGALLAERRARSGR